MLKCKNLSFFQVLLTFRNEQVYQNFFRNTYLSCLLQKKKYPIVVSIKETSNKIAYFDPEKVKFGIQNLFAVQNKGFADINKFISERISLKLIDKKKQSMNFCNLHKNRSSKCNKL